MPNIDLPEDQNNADPMVDRPVRSVLDELAFSDDESIPSYADDDRHDTKKKLNFKLGSYGTTCTVSVITYCSFYIYSRTPPRDH